MTSSVSFGRLAFDCRSTRCAAFSTRHACADDSHPDAQELVELELRERQARNLAARTRLAALGKFLPLDRFDWNHPRRLDRALYQRLHSIDFVERGDNVLLRGPGAKTLVLAEETKDVRGLLAFGPRAGAGRGGDLPIRARADVRALRALQLPAAQSTEGRFRRLGGARRPVEEGPTALRRTLSELRGDTVYMFIGADG
jgi:IstB-like ATP binding protein